jgi:7,8-dihydroneopterin aldolase/epimerase/oxygenase
MERPTEGFVQRRDAVFVRGLEFEANHGYTAAERRGTRRFRVSLELQRPLTEAARSDVLRDTLDYRKICEIAIRSGTETTFRLLEGLAGHVGRSIQEAYPGVDVVVEVEKLAPPCPGVPEACGVRLTLCA